MKEMLASCLCVTACYEKFLVTCSNPGHTFFLLHSFAATSAPTPTNPVVAFPAAPPTPVAPTTFAPPSTWTKKAS